MATEVQVYEGDGDPNSALQSRVSELEATQQRELYDLRSRLHRCLISTLARDEYTRLALSQQVYAVLEDIFEDISNPDLLRHQVMVLEHMERTITVIERGQLTRRTHRRVMLAIAIPAVLVALILTWCYLH